MGGRFLVETNTQIHKCYPPTRGSSSPEAGLGSVWECECGRHFVVRRSILDAPAFTLRRVPAWRRVRPWHFSATAVIGRSRRSG